VGPGTRRIKEEVRIPAKGGSGQGYLETSESEELTLKHKKFLKMGW